MKPFIVMLALGLALGACDNKDATRSGGDPSAKSTSTPKGSSGKDAKKPKEAKPAGDTKPASADMSDTDIDGAEIPVPEDFEEEAEKKVTKDSLEAEVKKLEEEIAGDK